MRLVSKPLRVASIGMGWWSDVLADAMVRSGKLAIAACYSRSEEKRAKFAAKYGCRAVASYEEILDDPGIEAIVNTTPNSAHLETTRAAAAAGKHVFLDKPIANTVADARALTQACRAAPAYEEILDDPTIEAIVNTTPNAVHLETTREAAGAGKHVFLDKPIANTVADARALTKACREAGVVLALGYQRRRESHFRWVRERIDAGEFGRLVNAESNISRDRLGKIDLSSWRYTAEGMPGGVLLQIGIHYTDVLEYLMGPIRAVSAASARLVLPGDNPDVASVVLEHDNGALSTLNASYASAAEHYVMNVYGKEATAYYDLQHGLSILRRGETRAKPVDCAKNDPIVEELEEFAAAARGECEPEMDGERSTASLAVILAAIRSAREGRRVEVKEMLA